jgi:hypothetical protein
MRSDLYELPEGLPVPMDDGACDHLTGLEMPSVKLRSTHGALVDVGEISRTARTVLFF